MNAQFATKCVEPYEDPERKEGLDRRGCGCNVIEGERRKTSARSWRARLSRFDASVSRGRNGVGKREVEAWLDG